MKVIYNKNEGTVFSDMKEGTIFLYNNEPFMKVSGVTKDTVTEDCFFAVNLAYGELYDFFFMDKGDDCFPVVEATLTIE